MLQQEHLEFADRVLRVGLVLFGVDYRTLDLLIGICSLRFLVLVVGFLVLDPKAKGDLDLESWHVSKGAVS